MRRRSVLRAGLLRLVVAVGATILSLAAAEGTLRVWPRLLGDTFANGVLSGYTAGSPRGIYYQDRVLGMNFMIPNHRTTMYYNRYVWEHESDAYGFRNRDIEPPAEVMLLGDSLIYGHGVEYEHTVGHILGRLTGLTVMNLARQGDCTVQQAYLLTEYLPVFRARVVFYHFFENDIADVYQHRTDGQMEEFIATPVAALRFPPRIPVEYALWQRDAMFRQWSLLRRLRDRLFLYKAMLMIRPMLAPSPAGAKAGRPPPADIDDARSLGWRYTLHAIAYMRDVAARHGAQLVIVPIVPNHPQHRAILRAAAAEHQLPLLDTTAFTPADASLWLPRDGHFSPVGARRMAEIERDYLDRRQRDLASPAIGR